MSLSLVPDVDPQAGPRERLLAVAERLFYADGIRATGIDKIIAMAGVTKVTFYRQFASKNELIREVLERRHQRWMDWFRRSLGRHGGQAAALVPTLAEWFDGPDYRGCAFINSVGELTDTPPDVALDIARRHKQEMESVIATLLPPSRQRASTAAAIALAADGAMVRAQIDGASDAALRALKRVVNALS